MDASASVDKFGRDMIDFFRNIDFSPIFPQIRTVIQTSISRNFSEGGRYGNDNIMDGGSNKWTKSKRAIKQSGQTLRDTGQLAASIRVDVTQTGHTIFIEVGSNKPYAAIHQFGGDIQRAAHSKLYIQHRAENGKFEKGTKFGKGGVTVGPYTIHIEARPFLVIQDEDIEEIQQIIVTFLATKFR